MVDYKNGKVYKLVCNVTGLVYVGSTTQALSVRKAGHVRDFKDWRHGKRGCITACKIIENGNHNIVLLEEVQCENKEQLHRKEREWIERLQCVNKHIPTRTKAEYRQTNRERIAEKRKEHYRANKDMIAEKKKEYYRANKEKIAENMKQYRQANREQIVEKRKQYRQANWEQIVSKKMQSHQCPCGSSYTHCHKARHERTHKHQEWFKNSNVAPEI
jgi:hypothetical protein